MRNLILSPAQLDLLERCPREYFFRYELNRDSIESNKAFAEGEYLHFILEQYYIARKARLYEQSDIVEKARIKAQEFDKLTVTECESLLETFLEYQEFHANETWEIQDIEKPFTKVLHEDEKFDLRIVIKGKADLLIGTQGLDAVVDHKKIARNRTPTPRNNQILCYPWAFDRRDFIINQLGIQKSLEPKDKFRRHFFALSQSQIDEWKEQTIYKAFEMVKFWELKFWPARFHSCADPITGRKCIFHPVCERPQSGWSQILSDSGLYQPRPDHELMGTIEETNE